MSNHEGFDAAYDYTVRFFPRFFSWTQFNINSDNSEGKTAGQNYDDRLTGPMGMGPEYKVVVAVNDDTIYAEAFVDTSSAPVILYIPPYQHSYSIPQMDVFGNVLSANPAPNAPHYGGTYAFLAPGSSST